MINILQMMIISTAVFDGMIAQLGVNLTVDSEMYFITYLFANFMAYFLIIIFIKTILGLYFKIFSKQERTFLWVYGHLSW